MRVLIVEDDPLLGDGLASGLRSLAVKQPKRKPGTAAVQAKAVVSGIDVTALAEPLAARVLLSEAEASSGACGEARFAGPAGVNPTCKLSRGGSLSCRARKRR